MFVIAKNDEDALAKMHDLQRENIIGAFDEEYIEADGKRAALRFLAKGFLYADAVFVNGSFEDNEEIVERIIANLNSYMAENDILYTFEYEAA